MSVRFNERRMVRSVGPRKGVVSENGDGGGIGEGGGLPVDEMKWSGVVHVWFIGNGTFDSQAQLLATQ